MNEIRNLLTFRTEIKLDDYFTSTERHAHIPILPAQNSKWTMNLLLAFLNQMNSFTQERRRAFTITKTHPKRVFFYFNHRIEEGLKLFVQIQPSIVLKLSLTYIRSHWTRKHIMISSLEGKGGKILTKMTYREHIYYETCFSDVNAATIALLYDDSVLFIPKSYFSDIFHYFATKIAEVNVDNSSESKSLQQYIDIWIEKEKKTINSLEDLKENINGYLKLTVQSQTGTRRAAKVKVNEQEMNIISGVYITPWARSILTENEGLVQGFLLDTTWAVMPFYVTAILMSSSYSAGIPLGFSFGNSEDKMIYNNILQTVSLQTNYSFEGKVIESDQGSALRSSIKEFKMLHLACLRHLLVSLKMNEPSFIIGHLLRAASEKDYTHAQEKLLETLLQTKDADKLSFYQNILSKVGLSFNGTSVDGYASDRWHEVSILQRIALRMPTTTNSLESTHGHLNAKTPRRNNFWMSLYRIVEHIMLKSQNVNKAIKRNYNHAVAKTKKRAGMLDNERLEAESKYYETTNDNCLCSENKVMSAMLGVNLPCSHRIRRGEPIPKCPSIAPFITNQWNELHIEFEIIPQEEPLPARTTEYYDKKMAVNMIKRCSKYKSTEKIQEYVDEHYSQFPKPIESFLNNHPDELIDMINAGINYFSSLIT